MQKFKGAKQEVIKATKAMHVETDETKFRKVKEFMDKFNSSSRPRFVNDALLRFVPEFQPNKVTMSVKTSINELALKQYQACSGGMKFLSIEGLMGELTNQSNSRINKSPQLDKSFYQFQVTKIPKNSHSYFMP